MAGGVPQAEELLVPLGDVHLEAAGLLDGEDLAHHAGRDLQSFAYLVLREHMETCVVEEIQKGNLAVVDEAVELMKKLK